MLGATIQMAWKHGRDYHVIKTRRGYDLFFLTQLEVHELTHLNPESEARQKGKNLFFATSAQSREAGIRSIAGGHPKAREAGIFRRVDHKNDPLDSCRAHWLFI